ncbi:Sec-independent protein translocase protein TatA [Pseudomonas sp. TE3786]
MLQVNSSNVLGHLSQQVNTKLARDPSQPVDMQEALQGIKVTLSEQAQKISSAAKGSNDDIDNSSLPDGIKQALKMIRQLRQQIAEKQAELQAVMADQSLSDEARAQKAQGVQSQLATLNGALITANGALLQAVKEAGLSPDQLQEMSGLLMA